MLTSETSGNWLREPGDERAQTLRFTRNPRAQHWYDISIGVGGVEVELRVISQSKVVAGELYIGDDKQLFGRLYEHRRAIETEPGFPLDWRPMPNRKASRILREREGDFTDPAQAAHLADWLVQTGDAFADIFLKYLPLSTWGSTLGHR